MAQWDWDAYSVRSADGVDRVEEMYRGVHFYRPLIPGEGITAILNYAQHLCSVFEPQQAVRIRYAGSFPLRRDPEVILEGVKRRAFMYRGQILIFPPEVSPPYDGMYFGERDGDPSHAGPIYIITSRRTYGEIPKRMAHEVAHPIVLGEPVHCPRFGCILYYTALFADEFCSVCAARGRGLTFRQTADTYADGHAISVGFTMAKIKKDISGRVVEETRIDERSVTTPFTEDLPARYYTLVFPDSVTIDGVTYDYESHTVT